MAELVTETAFLTVKKEKKKTHKVHFGDIFFSLVFVCGLGLLLYPTLADFWNRYVSTNVVMAYDKAMEELKSELAAGTEGSGEEAKTELDAEVEAAHAYNDNLAEHPDRVLIDSELQRIFEEAEAYNATLVEDSPYDINPHAQSMEDYEYYMSLLNPLGDGLMGYISIDSIDVQLPIYHGTSDTELQVGVGHLAGSSLPVGGPSTHAVIAGHSGLPSARLFSDLEDLQKGDIFVITVLGERLGYEIDSMKKVLPDDVSDLKIIPDEDIVTLITCWPYGINTHRLLVKGHRVDLPPEELDALVNGSKFPWLGLILTVSGALGLIAIVLYLVWHKKKSPARSHLKPSERPSARARRPRKSRTTKHSQEDPRAGPKRPKKQSRAPSPPGKERAYVS